MNKHSQIFVLIALGIKCSLSAVTFHIANYESQPQAVGVKDASGNWTKAIVQPQQKVTLEAPGDFVEFAHTFWHKVDPVCYETYGGGSGWACDNRSYYDVLFYGKNSFKNLSGNISLLLKNSSLLSSTGSHMSYSHSKHYPASEWHTYQYIGEVEKDDWNV
jgi:hypothetical protein